MATFITGLIVLVVTLTAIFILIKDKKNGKKCHSCSGCSCCCDKDCKRETE